MQIREDDWTLEHLQANIQAAVDLELWTIPFYLSAMYSIKDRTGVKTDQKSILEDRTTNPYQLIRTVVNQEMLHLQSASNIANAYGFSPTFKPPVYKGTTIPHLDFSLDNQKVIDLYKPYTAEIGPLDQEHINAMCLIEIPDYLAGDNKTVLQTDVKDYGTIAAFYGALLVGVKLLKNDIKGGVKQVDFFSAYYNNMPNMIVSETKDAGLQQVELLISLITDQGEGRSLEREFVKPTFQNTADDIAPVEDHFDKFTSIRDKGTFPEVFPTTPACDYTDKQKELEGILIAHFAQLMASLEGLFSGENPQNFFPVMSSVGASIRNCWEHGVTPKFS